MDNYKPRHSDRIIKVCGMCDPDNIRSVASLAPMLMGFIFYKSSPRDASALDPEVVRSLPHFIRPVALFVNSDEDHIMDITSRYGIKIVQLHGDETPEFCDRLRTKGLTVFKALPVSTESDVKDAKRYDGYVDLLVFDSRSASRGGSGKQFDWQLLHHYDGTTHYLIGGGVGPDDIDHIIDAMLPLMAGIDINSRFEISPGIKDISKLITFILNLRQFNEDESIAVPVWEKTK